MKTCSLVENICVYGDSKEMFCVALVIPNQDKLTKLAKNLCLHGDTQKPNILQLFKFLKKKHFLPKYH